MPIIKMHKNAIGSKLRPMVSKEEIEKGCEEEREGSFVPIFPPPCFGIMRINSG